MNAALAPLALDALNAAPDAGAFAALLDGLYPGAPWVAVRAAAWRPFPQTAALTLALVRAVREASDDERLALLRAHPGCDFAGDAPDLEALRRGEAAWMERFGFPFVLAPLAEDGTALSPGQMLSTLERRRAHPIDHEAAECLRQLHRIAEQRLEARLGQVPSLGRRIVADAAALAVHSDPGFAERGQLTVTYLTDAHRACARHIDAWMREAGFDEVAHDAVGNVVGVYHGTDPGARRLLTGSHYDTVRNGGRHDGRLGILVPIACVRELARAGRRLPFGLEVVAFAEEEGQRYKATFLASGALVGRFDPAWLDQRDAGGTTMREAMQGAGLRIEDIASIERDPATYLGFVEVHIEQGPVLTEADLPLGVVTSINGSVRYVGEAVGLAAHAGTTPMGRRRDAAAAVAETLLLVERRAAERPDVVGTVGLLEVPGGSINVVPGRCRFSLDLRATTDAERDACEADVLAGLRAIAARRGVSIELERTMQASAAPSDPAWQARWERAVASLGLPVHRMPSGAGHDAMMLHRVMPQAMLFVRGQNLGISHNPLESITDSDAELAVRAFQALLEDLAAERA